LKSRLDEFQEFSQGEPVMIALPGLRQVAVRILQLPGERRQEFAPGLNRGAGLLGTPEVAQAMDEDLAEPGAERPRKAVVREAGKLLADGLEDLLDEVFRVLVLQPLAAPPAMKIRGVQVEEVLPGIGVRAVTHALEQAGRGFGHDALGVGRIAVRRIMSSSPPGCKSFPASADLDPWATPVR
jgi:hypothetical protein